MTLQDTAVDFFRPYICKLSTFDIANMNNYLPKCLKKVVFDHFHYTARLSDDVTKCKVWTRLKISTKVLSARPAKIFNLSTTALTTCLCNAREHVAKSGEIRQSTTMS